MFGRGEGGVSEGGVPHVMARAGVPHFVARRGVPLLVTGGGSPSLWQGGGPHRVEKGRGSAPWKRGGSPTLCKPAKSARNNISAICGHLSTIFGFSSNITFQLQLKKKGKIKN